MIDAEGYRANVGIILVGQGRLLFWGRRIGQDAWQFPQGGMRENETPVSALYRELTEEIGLEPDDVKIIAESKEWISYRIPHHLLRHYRKPLCIGQKQKWFLLQLMNHDQKIRLDLSDSPEFDSWCWVDYWYPVDHVISFKRRVYQQILQEFSPLFEGV